MDALRGSIATTFAAQELHLLPDRAVYWPARRTLIVADVHLGKGTAFRKFGVPVPAGSSAKDLARLTSLLSATNANRLVVLGDLVHAKASHQQELRDSVTRWSKANDGIEMILVRGNHDRRAGTTPASWRIREVNEPFDDGLLLCHQPLEDSSSPSLCGHIHPVVILRDYDGSSVRAPCFVFDRNRAILPSFGSFTGGYVVEKTEGRDIYMTSGKSVVRVPSTRPGQEQL